MPSEASGSNQGGTQSFLPVGHDLFEHTVMFKGSTLTVSWQINYQHVQCDRMWRVRVAADQFTLYPNQFPEDVPIAQISEYNVTINSAACTDDVTLSLLLTENVIQHVAYVACIIRTGVGATSESYRSDNIYVYIDPSTTQTPETTTTQNGITNATTVRQGNPSTLSPAVSTDNVMSYNSSGRPHHGHVFHVCICLYLFTNIICIIDV